MKKLLLIFIALLAFGTVSYAAEEKPFVHPGILNTQADLDRIAAKVKAGEEPYLSGWMKLKESQYSQPGVKSRATETIIRGGNGDNVARLYIDAARAYQCALRWKIDGDSACGDTARDILNDYSKTLKQVSGNADRYLAAGLYGAQMANAAELMRDYEGFDVEAMKTLLLEVFYKPLSERFLFSNEFGGDHNDAYITNYWANWDSCNLAATIAIGIFCDRRDIYEKGIEYFKNGAGNGSVYNAMPYLYHGLAQGQESGRDQGHMTLVVGLIASYCEAAWNQGDDLYGWADNRFLHMAEYVARYNNMHDVPFMKYEWGTGQKGEYMSQDGVSPATRGATRSMWEMVYNHYVNRCGLDAPNVTEAVEKIRPEGGGGGHPSTFDILGFGTLLYTRDKGSGTAAEALEAPLQEGVYVFKSRSGGVLSAEGNKVLNSEYKSLDTQKWLLHHAGGGQYTITTMDGALSLSVEGGSFDNNAQMILAPYTGESSQKFAFIAVKGDAVRITPIHTNKPLKVNDDKSVVQDRYLLGDNQKWDAQCLSAQSVEEPINMRGESVCISVNGIDIKTDVEPIIEEGRTLIPVRAVTEAVGASVDWENTNRVVTITKGESEIALQIDNSTAMVDGAAQTMDVPAQIINARTFVPLRFITQTLGGIVKWNADERRVEIQI